MYFYTLRTINIFYTISEKINMTLILILNWNFIGEMVQKLAAKSVSYI